MFFSQGAARLHFYVRIYVREQYIILLFIFQDTFPRYANGSLFTLIIKSIIRNNRTLIHAVPLMSGLTTLKTEFANVNISAVNQI